MTTRRWQLLCSVLAISTVFFAYRNYSARSGSDHAAAKVDRAAVPTTSAMTRRQLRIPAAALGLSENKLIRQLKSARGAQEVVALCEKLGFVGTDMSVEALIELKGDRRVGVSAAALRAVGHIGTSRGTRFLLRLEETGTRQERAEAIAALGFTNAEAARERLIDIIADRADVHRAAAAYALGEIGGDEVVDHLEALALSEGDYNLQSAIIWALASIGSTYANDALIALSKSEKRNLRHLALARLGAHGENHAVLLEILETGDARSAAAAAQALGNAKNASAVPKLIELAESGSYQVRSAAISALGQIGGEEAIGLLSKLLRTNDGIAYSAASALITIGTDEARSVLIDAAMTSGGDRSQILNSLRSLRGPDIDAAMRSIAETGRTNERYAALNHLVTSDADGAVELAKKFATSGQVYQRQNAIRLLGQSGSEEAKEALRELARTGSGQVRIAALETLGDLGERSDELLIESLRTGSSQEASAAARALVNLGTPEAQGALVKMLGEEGPGSVAAAGMIYQMGNDQATRDALIAASEKNPAISGQVMQKLLTSGAPEGVELARKAIEGGDPSKASMAVHALSNASGDGVDGLIEDAAASGQAAVRASAAGVIARRGGPEATDTLIELVGDAETSVRDSALHGLGQLGTPEAVGALVDASANSDAGSRRAAISGLAMSGDERANARIIDLMRDSDDSVAMAAVWATHNAGSRADDALRALLADPARAKQVRVAVANQLSNRGTRLSDAEKAIMKELVPTLGGSHLSPMSRHGYVFD